MPPYPFGKGPIATAFETYVQDAANALAEPEANWDDGEFRARRRTFSSCCDRWMRTTSTSC